MFQDDFALICDSRDRSGDTEVMTALLHLLDGTAGTAAYKVSNTRIATSF